MSTTNQQKIIAFRIFFRNFAADFKNIISLAELKGLTLKDSSIFMKNNVVTKKVTATILSMSLLTVMAGAAIAPGLGVIKAHFNDSPDMLIQLIVSIPALLIILTNLFFLQISRLFRTRMIAITGLILYVAAGAGCFFISSIYAVALSGTLSRTVHLTACRASFSKCHIWRVRHNRPVQSGVRHLCRLSFTSVAHTSFSKLATCREL